MGAIFTRKKTMIPLPPGCSVTYSIWIDIDLLTEEIIEWYKLIGGEVKTDTYYDPRGRNIVRHYVRYNSKWCHHDSNGLFGTRLHFLGQDICTASMFMLKFNERVRSHNIKETMDRKDKKN
jgi:hypothetical protein